MLSRGVFDVGPQLQVVVGTSLCVDTSISNSPGASTIEQLTIKVRRNIQTPSLAARNRLRQAEQRGAQRADSLPLKDLCAIECRARGGDLDAEAVSADAGAAKLLIIHARVADHGGGVVGFRGKNLQQDTAFDVVDVELGERDGLF